MHAIALISVLLAASVFAQNVTTGKLGDAEPIDDNPLGASYFAILPNSLRQVVRGSIVAISAPDGKGVDFSVNFAGLPSSGGPFQYHIHDQPVPASGNCTGTLAHLDPYERGQEIPCDADKPETCQVGDLSGKYGLIKNRTSFVGAYNDPYASLKEGIGAFFGNRSFVIHYANSTRITCANFTRISEGEARQEIESAKSVALGMSSSTTATPSATELPAQTTVSTESTPTGANNTASATSSAPLVQSTGGAAALGSLQQSLWAIFAMALLALL